MNRVRTISDNEFQAESVRGLDDNHRFIPEWSEIRSRGGDILRWNPISGWEQGGIGHGWEPCAPPVREDGSPVATSRMR